MVRVTGAVASLSGDCIEGYVLYDQEKDFLWKISRKRSFLIFYVESDVSGFVVGINRVLWSWEVIRKSDVSGVVAGTRGDETSFLAMRARRCKV